jgi:hypothetical protein
MTTMIVDDLGRIPMSPYLTATLTRAADYATAQTHREIGLEHLLLALTEDPEATVVLKASNVDLAQLSAEVSEYLGRSDDRLQPDSNQTTAISTDLRRILEAAAAAARQGRRREINGAIVLAAIVGDGTSAAANFLRVQGLTFEEVIRALQRAAPVAPPPQAPVSAPAQAPVPVSDPAPPPPPPPVAAPAPRREPHPQPAPAPAPPPPTPAPAPRYPSPSTDFTQPASTEEILASARERLQSRPDPRESASGSAPVSLPRANYPDLGGPPHPASSHAAPPEPEGYPYANFGQTAPGAHLDEGLDNIPAPWPADTEEPPAAPAPSDGGRHDPRAPAPFPQPPAPSARAPDVSRTGPPAGSERRRAGSSGPFVGSWPLIEAGQLIENIPRRMRVALPVVVEARIARADVKALAEGLAGGGAVFRHEVVVTKAMSVRLRAPEGGFTIENRSPETQWIENVLGLGSDDFASWRWTVTPRTRGKRQLQLIVSARTVGADGVTAETALPDQVIEVRIATNYGRTAKRWAGWIAAAVVGGLLAKFGEMGFVIVKLLVAKYLGA